MPTTDPIAGIDGLYFAAKHMADGLYTGKHASLLRGAGIEFHDYRAYTPGDDLRSIDWKLFGRTDRYYLKRYRKETDLNLHVLVDGSASMDFSGIDQEQSRPTKFEIAKQLAATMLTLAIRQGDRAGLGIFDKQVRCLHPPTGSQRRLKEIIADLDKSQASKGQADLANSLNTVAQNVGSRKASLLVISDLLDEPQQLFDVFDRLRFGGHEVVVFQVLTADELKLPTQARGLKAVDSELGRSVKTKTNVVAKQYQTLMDEHLATIRRSLQARGIDHTIVDTSRPLLQVLRSYLQMRVARMR